MTSDQAVVFVVDEDLSARDGVEDLVQSAGSVRNIPRVGAGIFHHWPRRHFHVGLAMKSGAIEFLTKPSHEQSLLDAVNAGIERDCTRRHNVLACDLLRRRLRRNTPLTSVLEMEE